LVGVVASATGGVAAAMATPVVEEEEEEATASGGTFGAPVAKAAEAVGEREAAEEEEA